ncbi:MULTISPECIES: AraC family transcriptional regulator [unclassified Novosphingobium]|uniref:AraC family transcriptional regulator n=1 Tax=unclassified Novosphingobium TaxID=2644732 RepID=UPI0013571172|nr:MULTISPECIES: AraC family transcriptional regulator [unclassified Novosphingobium]
MSERIFEMRRRKLAIYAGYLGQSGADWQLEGPVDALAYLHSLAAVAMQAPPAMALEVGAGRRLAELGIIGHLILSAADLRETLAAWEHHAEMAGELANMSSRVSGKGTAARWRTQFSPMPFLAPKLARFVVEELVATFFTFAREATGAELADFEVALPFARAQGVDYERFLCSHVRFEQRAAVVTGPASALALPQVARDAETFDLLRGRLREPSSRSEGNLSPRLRGSFMARPGELPRLASTARHLGMSARTLSRRLAQEGVSFEQVLSDYRRTAGLELLRSDRMSVAEVAHLLGYRSESGLRRAFLAWTGMPIGRWRQVSKKEKGSLA